jgi:4-hydroxy-tetrahydrodipicolinate reductase
MAVDFDQVRVMVNGMPGPMATAAAEARSRKGLSLAPTAMTGPNVDPCIIQVFDTVSGKSAQVRLIPSTESELIASAIAGMKEASDLLLAIDYTHPSAVNENAKFYVKNKIPFVMGTTGGDRGALLEDVKGNFAVIAPNMGKQIVAMQSALEELAKKFPAAFEGYELKVKESHQKTKADTSGTAKAVIESLKVLTKNQEFEADRDVNMIRDDQESVDFGVPRDALLGHAFHTYTLTSPDGSVEFQLQHNVVGRTVYAEGTADAVKFLAKKIAEGHDAPQIYTMINVLEEGALE